MAKYYGKIGFYFDSVETAPGIWTELMDERAVYGDILRNVKRTENPGQANDNININNQISFVADPFAVDNFFRIKYATYMGVKWAVTSAEVAFPRIILNLGGIYNEEFETCSS